jgi:hypothetical protein
LLYIIKLVANSMKSQIFVAIGVAIVAAVLMTGLASTINAQSNMTGGNMTGGNMTGGNMNMPAGTTGDDGEDGDDGNENGDGDGDGGDGDGESGENN